MAIDKINTTAWASIASVTGVAKASIANFNGVDAPAASGGDMEISVITQTAFHYGAWNTSTSKSITMPSGASSGDFCLMVVCSQNGSNTLWGGTPSGWTMANAGVHWGSSVSDSDIYIYYRVLDGTEGSTVSVPGATTSTSPQRVIGTTMLISNVNASPISALGSHAVGSSNVTAPTVSSTGAGLFLCLCALDGGDGEPFTMTNGSFTLTAGWDTDGGRNSGKGVSGGMQYSTIGASTATGTTACSGIVGDGMVAGHIVIAKA
jgi:hypothetical protein